MVSQSIRFMMALALGLVLFAGAKATADEGKDKKELSGSWEKKEGQVKIAFSDKNVMKIFPHGEQFGFEVVCEYSMEKDNQIKAKITELNGKEEIKEKAKGALPIGYEFSFKYQIKDGVVTIEEMKGENIDHLKGHLEGEYEVKK
jgi:hypothetical protein